MALMLRLPFWWFLKSKMFRDSGDEIYHKLTLLHFLTLSSHANYYNCQFDFKIGDWGQRTGNIIFSQQLALLAFRLGDHLRHVCGSSTRARLSYDNASIILGAIPEHWISLFQLSCTLSQLHLSKSDVKTGRISIKNAQRLFIHLIILEINKVAEQNLFWVSTI